jgi:outer membrane protein assembly factor BamA
MKYALFSLLISGASLWGGNQQPVLDPVEFNVNSRYTVESVKVSREIETGISHRLRQDLEKLIGQKLNMSALNDLARRIRDELNVRTISQQVLRGDTPNHVKIALDVPQRPAKFELSVPRFVYHSSEGLSGSMEGALVAGDHRFTVGLVSDGDELAERYSGIRVRYDKRRLGTNRVRLRFEFDSYHEQWNRSTLNAVENTGAEDGAVGGLYRTRQNFEPAVTVEIARPLTISFGAGFERFDPIVPAARTQSANAAITTLRYERRFEGGGADQQDLEAGYSLRAATKALGSDYVYARHRLSVRYSIARGRHFVTDEAVAGLITGRAPLFERFELGTSSMLRGWNKWDLDPLGGSHVAYNSLEYRYGAFEVFYDTGAVWDQGQDAVLRHSLGVGIRKSSFQVAMAFPVKGGRASPVFMVGMNY